MGIDLWSLVPALLSGAAGLFGNNTNTTTQTPVVNPQLQQAITQLLGRAGTNFNKPYTPYTGDRTANPTASRAALDPVMAGVGQQAMGGLADANGYRARIRELLNGRSPQRVTAPTLVPGGPSAPRTGGGVPQNLSALPMPPAMPPTGAPPGTGGPMLPPAPLPTPTVAPPPAPVVPQTYMPPPVPNQPTGQTRSGSYI